MHYTIKSEGKSRTIHCARPYRPNRKRLDVCEPDNLQSSLLAILQIEDSVEVWEIADEDSVPELLRFLADHDTKVWAWSVANLLPAFRPNIKGRPLR